MIYDLILDEIDILRSLLKINTEHEEINIFLKIVQGRLTSISEDLNNSIKSFHENAEWETFTIAFYGETNAGKSTIIETLRILLNEPSKLQERDKIKQLRETLSNLTATSQKDYKQISKQLLKFCDGNIIGDGRSDFTQEVIKYQFECDGQNFALLDLPGIEGQEELVLSKITDAVKKAHAVFYITSKPTPPQSVDGNSLGVLEKIRKHLKDHTEVYSIFNKRAKNPQLLKSEIVDEEEKESLLDLDNVMRENIGEQYKTHFSLSAYPGFLAVSDYCEEKFEKSKSKFLDKFGTKDNLLFASRIKEFSDWLTNEMINNGKEKIKKSNDKKVYFILKKIEREIDDYYKEFNNIEGNVLKENKRFKRNLEDAVEDYKRQIFLEFNECLRKFEGRVRKRIYGEIEKEISNEKYESLLQDYMKEEVNSFKNSLDDRMKKLTIEFEEEINSLMKKSSIFLCDILGSEVSKINSKLHLEIDNDDECGAILEKVFEFIAILFLSNNPPGWLLFVASVISSFIDGVEEDDIKQKNNANKNIEKIIRKISEKFLENVEKQFKVLEVQIEKSIKKKLVNVEQIVMIKKAINDISIRFNNLSRNIKKEGNF